MPFGLLNAAQTFQNFIDEVVRGLPFCFAYIYDLLISSPEEASHRKQFPLPVLSDLLMNLGEGNKIFSSLDLLTGYWQVPMAPRVASNYSLSTTNGHFERLRMPFGLKTATITFQRTIQTLWGDLKDRNVFAYLDDVIIASPDVDSHLASLETVLSRLQTAGLKVKLSKCEFLRY